MSYLRQTEALKRLLAFVVIAVVASFACADTTATRQNVTVFKEPGRYGGWPANHGLWQWGDELVAGFQAAWYKPATNDHAIDRSRPSEHWQARSLDGGTTWTVEKQLPFAAEKMVARPAPLTAPLDFTAPNFALMFLFGSLHVGPSWFYVSNDRCRTWSGPFSFEVEGVDKICTRTDLVILGPHDCLMFGSAAKADNKEGRVFCARTTDGGQHWKLVARIGEEPPEGFSIMPSTVRLPSGTLLTAVRNGKFRNDITLFRSDDLGEHWTELGAATDDIGGNPPAMVLLKDGRICLTYGCRRKPFGARARLSSDEGRTWGPEIMLRDDGLTGDLGYPRSVARPDGKVLTVYYFNGPRDEDRTIQGTLWTPPFTEPAAETSVNTLGMRLVRIASGRFIMGQDGPAADYRMNKHPEKCDDADWDEKPAHPVTITTGFLMGATEVTLGQYRRFKPEHRRDNGTDDEAARGVSWNDAVAFCEWLSKKEGKPYRLPTEAEWEYACRAGTETLFNTGNALPDGSQAWFGDRATRERYFADRKMPAEYRVEKGPPSLRVARASPNAWGLYDMHGNVAEWCSDWYGPYETGKQSDPLGRFDGDFRVFRGGSHSVFTRLLRSANRAAWIPETVSEKIGFRVVMGEPPRGHRARQLSMTDVRQTPSTNAVTRAEEPFFSGPKPFVIVPTSSAGPLFSAHNHSPSITECPNGDLLAVWYSCVDEAGSELNNIASRLLPGSESWTPAEPFWDGADVNDHAPKVWWDGDKTLFHFACGLVENVVRTSTDNGMTWSKARIIQPVGEFGNGVLRLKDGTLVLGNDARHVSLVTSRDGGMTWAYNEADKQGSDFRPGGKGPRYPGIHAPMVQLADGRIMAMSRCDQVEDQSKFNFKTPVSTSRDLGKTWTYEASDFPAISSVQRAAMIRLREGPILLCSFTDQWRDWKNRKGLPFKAKGGSTFTGYGMFAALSLDEGKTWPVKRLVTPGGEERQVNGIDRLMFEMGDTMAEPCGYLAMTQTRDGNVQLITSRNHYVFNLAWLNTLPEVR